MNVSHKVFGTGTVKSIAGGYVTIVFAAGEKRFQFPQAFNSFLKTQDSTLLHKIEEENARSIKKDIDVKVTAKNPIENTTKSVSKFSVTISYGSNSLVGDRAQGIYISSEEEMFEIVGYMASPRRVSSIEAEVPKDGRDKVFEAMFPGQKYRPIELGYTPSGLPNKLSPQFRINFGNIRNCPAVLKQNMGKGNGACVARINKSKFVIKIVQEYGFRFGEYQDIDAIRSIAENKGYKAAFERGYKL